MVTWQVCDVAWNAILEMADELLARTFARIELCRADHAAVDR